MKKVALVLNSVVLTSLTAISGTLFSSTALSQTFTMHNGSICDPFFANQGHRMERRWYGLVNKHPDKDLWMLCPVATPVTSSLEDTFGVILVAGSDQQGQSFTCRLRFLNWSTLEYQSSNISGTTASLDSDPELNAVLGPLDFGVVFEWSITNPSPNLLPPSAQATVSCLVPTGGAVVNLTAFSQ